MDGTDRRLRGTWQTETVDALRDIRFALRALRRAPSLALVALLAMTLGIGANTVVFSLVNTALLHPLPFPSPQSLVRIESSFSGSPTRYLDVSLADIPDIQRDSRALEKAGFYKLGSGMTLTGTGTAARVNNVFVSPNLFEVLGAGPALGRDFRPSDSEEGDRHVAIISDSFWRSYLGSRPDAVGSTLRLDNQPYTVVGVMHAGFGFPSPLTQVWIPAALPRVETSSGSVLDYAVIGRTRRGITPRKFDAELYIIAERLQRDDPADAGLQLTAFSLQDQIVGPTKKSLLMLACAVALVLLIACLNVGTLLFVRYRRREQEIAVRAALGASRAQMVRQLMAEGCLLALGGGSLALLASVAGVHAVRVLAPPSIPRVQEVGINVPVLCFAGAVSLLAGLVFSLIPLLHGCKFDLVGSLRGGSLVSHGRFGLSYSRGLQNGSAVTQVAVAVILLICTGLLLRSLANLLSVPLGFDPQNVLAVEVSEAQLPQDKLISEYDELLREIRALPGVRWVALVSNLPLGRLAFSVSAQIAGKRSTQGNGKPGVHLLEVSPDYFRTMGIPVVKGRAFAEEDSAGAPNVAIINEFLAAQLFPGESPVGRRLDVGNGFCYCRVIGVTGNVRDISLEDPPGPEIYMTYRQQGEPVAAVLVRTTGNALRLGDAVAGRIWSEDPAERVLGVMTMQSVANRSSVGPRFHLALLGFFGLLALCLSAIGIYGVLEYSVSRQIREIGIRVALGAKRTTIYWLVLRQALLLTLAGLCVGCATALALGRTIASLLFGVVPTDWVTFAGIALLIMLTALLASYIPARRALKIGAASALRYE